jgi:hypothetical protein
MNEEIKKEESNNINSVVEEKDILQQLLEQSEENNKLLHKIRSYQNQQRIMGYLKILIIVIPIILSIVYLPAIIKPFWDQYLQVMGIDTSTSTIQSLQNMTKELRQ